MRIKALRHAWPLNTCRLADRELANNRERLTRSLKAVDMKLQTQQRVGPIPVSAHLHQGGATAQYAQTRLLLAWSLFYILHDNGLKV